MSHEFLAEAAVLVAVFPVLEALIASRQPQSTPVTWKWVIGSEVIAAVLFFGAVVISIMEGD